MTGLGDRALAVVRSTGNWPMVQPYNILMISRLREEAKGSAQPAGRRRAGGPPRLA